MNEDLKKEVYQRVSDYVEDPKNVSILLAKRFANTIKEIYPSISIARFYRMEIIRRKNDY